MNDSINKALGASENCENGLGHAETLTLILKMIIKNT